MTDVSFRPLSGVWPPLFRVEIQRPAGLKKPGGQIPAEARGKVGCLHFQASRPHGLAGHREPTRLPGWLLVSSASISPQMAFTVPLVPEPWLCQAAPLPDSPSQGPLPLPSHSGRDQTLDGQRLSLRNGPSRGFTGLHSYPAMSGARRGCPCLLCPQRWEPAGAAPAPPHAAHQIANSFLKP